MAFRISPASAEVSAMRSCEARDSLRTRRPNQTMGRITASRVSKISDDNCTLVTNSITIPPMNRKRFLSASEMLVPTTVWISVVSVVRRDSTSPVRVISKNCGLCVTTCVYTLPRRSVVMRSPSQDTM
jgi:hypothetical protein